MTAGACSRCRRPWDGAQELLRQATYYAMKRRAGTVGERGLGPVLGQLAAEAHRRCGCIWSGTASARGSCRSRCAGCPKGVRTVKSVTLLQGGLLPLRVRGAAAPRRARASGVLHGQQNRIDGPLVCCHSQHDSALGTIYPLASRMAGDARTVLGLSVNSLLGAKWGAIGLRRRPGGAGHPVVQARRRAQGPKLPTSGCVNIDAAAVVRRGGAPSGAHSDICHRELARVVLAAGRIV